MAILIVDDEPAIRGMLGELLDDEGYPTILAVDGADALVQLTTHQEPPHLILLDMMMPRMNGWEFLRALETYPELNRIPVIVLSAQTIQPQQAAMAHVVAHLTKPIDLERLLSLVDRIYQTGA